MITVQRFAPAPMPQLHLHEHHEFIYVVQGGYRSEVDGKVIAVPPGHSIFYPAGTEHRPLTSPGFSLYLVQWRDADTAPQRIRAATYPRLGSDGTGVLQGMLRQMLSWVGRREIHQEDMVAALRVVLRLHAGVDISTESNPLLRARQLLESYLADPVSLGRVAESVGMSPSLLGRLFKEHFGFSPMAYRRQCRLDRAMTLLREGSLGLEEIARAVGYATGSHLSNLLHRDRGLRPRDVKRATRDQPADD